MKNSDSALRYVHKPSLFSSHQKLLRLVASNESDLKVCLDIGCATGYFSSELRDLGWSVIGIEPDLYASKLALENCEKVINSRIEDVNFSQLPPYNCVILGDVLEHLAQPDLILRSIVDNLETEGTIYLSIPNIANVSVRLLLMMGKFNYTNRGILDHTHLRFFTFKSALQLVRDSSLIVEKVQVTPIPIEIAFTLLSRGYFRWLLFILDRVTRIFPKLLGYQIIIQAKKKS
jgi:2-polyprenyl-3-methyl-5-hydroxy-6-metoxy-1,4-benzoquinol methylase